MDSKKEPSNSELLAEIVSLKRMVADIAQDRQEKIELSSREEDISSTRQEINMVLASGGDVLQHYRQKNIERKAKEREERAKLKISSKRRAQA